MDGVYTIYDAVLKLIMLVYGIDFLKYICIEQEVEEVLKTEFTKFDGSKIHLDFLCRLKDRTLCNIEFQFPKAYPKDLDRFFDYNITAQVTLGSLTETVIINFTTSSEENIYSIGKTKCFRPTQIYLGDIDYDTRLENINKKCASNIKLTSFEEIDLMLITLMPKYKDKAHLFQNICKILKKEYLFDETKLDFIKDIIMLEITRFLSKEEIKDLGVDVKMTPEQREIVLQAISEMGSRMRYEAKQEGIKEGEKRVRDIARKLKEGHDFEFISNLTGLSIEEIEQL